MTSLKEKQFKPDPAAHAVYDELYRIYRELHDTFGGVSGAKADLGDADEEAAGDPGAAGALRREVAMAEVPAGAARERSSVPTPSWPAADSCTGRSATSPASIARPAFS